MTLESFQNVSNGFCGARLSFPSIFYTFLPTNNMESTVTKFSKQGHFYDKKSYFSDLSILN